MVWKGEDDRVCNVEGGLFIVGATVCMESHLLSMESHLLSMKLVVVSMKKLHSFPWEVNPSRAISWASRPTPDPGMSTRRFVEMLQNKYIIHNVTLLYLRTWLSYRTYSSKMGIAPWKSAGLANEKTRVQILTIPGSRSEYEILALILAQKEWAPPIIPNPCCYNKPKV